MHDRSHLDPRQPRGTMNKVNARRNEKTMNYLVSSFTTTIMPDCSQESVFEGCLGFLAQWAIYQVLKCFKVFNERSPFLVWMGGSLTFRVLTEVAHVTPEDSLMTVCMNYEMTNWIRTSLVPYHELVYILLSFFLVFSCLFFNMVCLISLIFDCYNVTMIQTHWLQSWPQGEHASQCLASIGGSFLRDFIFCYLFAADALYRALTQPTWENGLHHMLVATWNYPCIGIKD